MITTNKTRSARRRASSDGKTRLPQLRDSHPPTPGGVRSSRGRVPLRSLACVPEGPQLPTLLGYQRLIDHLGRDCIL